MGESHGSGALKVLYGHTYDDWETIYEDNVVGFYKLVYRQVGNRPDAEDLVAEIFTSALPHIDLPASVGKVRAYLVATARTVIADHWRRHHRVPLCDIPIEAVDNPSIEAEVDDSRVARVARVHRLLQRMPDNFRRVLELRFLRGYSVRETADEMGISVSNAKVMQFRALQRAATMVEEADS